MQIYKKKQDQGRWTACVKTQIAWTNVIDKVCIIK